MEFTNEFLKWLVGDLVDSLDKEYKESDKRLDDMERPIDMPTDERSYGWSLGRRALAREIRESLLAKLGRESLKRAKDSGLSSREVEIREGEEMPHITQGDELPPGFFER